MAVTIGTISANTSNLPRYEKYEATFSVSGAGVMKTDTNPYNPRTDGASGYSWSSRGVFVQAVVTRPDGTTFEWPCYYDKSGNWKFRPPLRQVGTYSYYIYVRHANGNATSPAKTFTTTENTDPLHKRGFLTVDTNDWRFFSFDNDTCFYPMGVAASTDANLIAMGTNGGNWQRIFRGSHMFEQWTGSGHKVNQYFDSDADYWEHLLDVCYANGVFIQLLLNDWTRWKSTTDNPYIAEGCATSAADAFANATVREVYKRKLRWMMARWGWTPALAGFDLVNEVGIDMRNFTIDMGQFITETSANQPAQWYHNSQWKEGSKFVTSDETSTVYRTNEVPWENAACHICNYHDYGREAISWGTPNSPNKVEALGSTLDDPWKDTALWANRMARVHKKNGWAKPLSWTEYGLLLSPGFADWTEAYNKDTGAQHMKDWIWGLTFSGIGGNHWLESYMQGDYGGGSKWWVFKPISTFLQGADFRGLTCTSTYQDGSVQNWQVGTPPAEDSTPSWKFVFMADSRSTGAADQGGVNQVELNKIIDLINLDAPDFVIFGGDAAYADAVGASPSTMADTWMACMNRLTCPWYCTLGNHDRADSTTQDSIWRAKLTQPTNGPATDLEFTYYFDHKNARVVALNSYHWGQEHHAMQGGAATAYNSAPVKTSIFPWLNSWAIEYYNATAAVAAKDAQYFDWHLSPDNMAAVHAAAPGSGIVKYVIWREMYKDDTTDPGSILERTKQEAYCTANGINREKFICHYGKDVQVIYDDNTTGVIPGWDAANDPNGDGVRDWPSDQGTSTGRGSGYLDDNTKSWTPNQWVSAKLTDSAGTQFTVTSNTATRLSFVGTPAAGRYGLSANGSPNHLATAKTWAEARVKQFIWQELAYALNIGDADYRAYRVYDAVKLLVTPDVAWDPTASANWDGLMVDNTQPEFPWPQITNGTELINEFPTKDAAWRPAQVTLFTQVKAAIGSKVLMPNIGNYPYDEIIVAATTAHEEMMVAVTNEHGPSIWDHWKAQSDAGRYITVYPTWDIWDGTADADRERIHLLAFHYVGQEPYIYLGFRGFGYTDPGVYGWAATSSDWFAAAGVDVGAPTEKYKLVKSGVDPAGQTYEIYSRAYSKALMVCRPKLSWDNANYGATSAVTYTLPSYATATGTSNLWRPLNVNGTLGTAVSSVSLQNPQSAILFPSDTSGEAPWVAAVLSGAAATHKFVFTHDPAYPVANHIGGSLDAYPTERDDLWNRMTQAGVRAFFCGHEHLYSRVAHGSITQIIGGSCGAPLTTGISGTQAVYHYVLVTVAGTKVTVQAKNDAGAVIDSYSYDLSGSLSAKTMTCNNPQVMVTGFQSATRVYLYVKNLTCTWFGTCGWTTGVPTPADQTASITVKGLTPGTYVLEKWSTRDTNPATMMKSTVEVPTNPNGDLTFATTVYQSGDYDWGYKIYPSAAPGPQSYYATAAVNLAVATTVVRSGNNIFNTSAGANLALTHRVDQSVTYSGGGSTVDMGGMLAAAPCVGPIPQGAQVNTSHPLAGGMVGLWGFTEAGGLLAFDRMSSIGCVISGADWVEDTNKGGCCLRFVSVNNDWVHCGASTWLRSLGDFSIGFWVKPNSLPGLNSYHFLACQHNASQGVWWVGFNGDYSGAFYGGRSCGTTNAEQVADWVPPIGDWVFVVATYATATDSYKLYAYGYPLALQFDTAGVGARTANSSIAVTLGNRQTGGRAADVDLGMVCAWNRILSPEEVWELSQNPQGLFLTSQMTPVALLASTVKVASAAVNCALTAGITRKFVYDRSAAATMGVSATPGKGWASDIAALADMALDVTVEAAKWSLRTAEATLAVTANAAKTVTFLRDTATTLGVTAQAQVGRFTVYLVERFNRIFGREIGP